jgi:extradiol dioxygenase family protein
MILEEVEFQATIPRTGLVRARRFYEEKLGFSPERDLDIRIIYRFGTQAAFFLSRANSANLSIATRSG